MMSILAEGEAAGSTGKGSFTPTCTHVDRFIARKLSLRAPETSCELP